MLIDISVTQYGAIAPIKLGSLQFVLGQSPVRKLEKACLEVRIFSF